MAWVKIEVLSSPIKQDPAFEYTDSEDSENEEDYEISGDSVSTSFDFLTFWLSFVVFWEMLLFNFKLLASSVLSFFVTFDGSFWEVIETFDKLPLDSDFFSTDFSSSFFFLF